MKGEGLFLFQKKADNLNMTTAELTVWGVHEGKEYPCIMNYKEISNDDFFICEIRDTMDATFQHLKVSLLFKLHQCRQYYGEI